MPENPLEKFLAIIDKKDRLNQLTKYAKSLKVNCAETQTSNIDEINEEKLVILIYDAQNKRKKSVKTTIFYSSVTAFLAVSFSLIILFSPNFFSHFIDKAYKDEIEVRPKKSVIMYDKNGRPLSGTKKPVVIEVMDGMYNDYDENGKIKSISYYRNGELIKRKSASELEVGGQTLNFR